jgi:hypothetical protein
MRGQIGHFSTSLSTEIEENVNSFTASHLKVRPYKEKWGKGRRNVADYLCGEITSNPA